MWKRRRKPQLGFPRVSALGPWEEEGGGCSSGVSALTHVYTGVGRRRLTGVSTGNTEVVKLL